MKTAHLQFERLIDPDFALRQTQVLLECEYALAQHCREHAHLLSELELAFVTDTSRPRRPPSEKQLSWLRSIAERLEAVR